MPDPQTTSPAGPAVFRFAIRNLTSRPARTALATLGLAVAIAGMVGLFSIREGIQSLVGRTFQNVPGSVVLADGAPMPLFSALPQAWADEIAALPEAGPVTAESWARANVINGKQIISPPRLLLGADLPSRLSLGFDVYRDNMVAGRFLETSDAGTANAVLSRPIADEFDLEVGDAVTVNGLELTVVGLAEASSILLDVAILIDEGVMRRHSRFDADTVSDFYVEPAEDVTPDELKEAIEGLFEGREAPRRASRLSGGGLLSLAGGWAALLEQAVAYFTGSAIRAGSAAEEPGDGEAGSAVEVTSASDWAGKAEKFTGNLDVFLSMLTGIGLLIAVLSIVNTMLMSVAERTTEFGVLRANGWSRGQIVRLICVESAAIGLAGGLVGDAAGWAGVQAVNARFPDRAHLYASPQLLVFGVLFALLLGVGGGLYPAWRAAKLSPIEAIRR